MRHAIAKTEYDHAWSADLAEAFEGMIQQRQYIEVVVVNGRDKGNELIGRVETFKGDIGLHNGSYYWDRVDRPVSKAHPNGFTYAQKVAKEDGLITEEYFAYDTLDDAIAHYGELLRAVRVEI